MRRWIMRLPVADDHRYHRQPGCPWTEIWPRTQQPVAWLKTIVAAGDGSLRDSLFRAVRNLAQFERELMRERTMAGLGVARGRTGGRPPVLTGDKLVLARQMYDSKDFTIRQIAKATGVSVRTIVRRVASLTTE
jgi:hypothetical protein